MTGRKTFSAAAAALALVLVLAGCTPLRHGVFVTERDDLSLLLEREPPPRSDAPRPAKRVRLEPGRRHKVEVHPCDDVTVLRGAGEPVFARRGLTVVDPERQFSRASEFVTFYLVTGNGVYPIPRAWRSKWMQHVEEITGQRIEWLRCPLTVDGEVAVTR